MIDEKLRSRFGELKALGERLLLTRRSPQPGHITGDFVDVQLANQWFTIDLILISNVFGRESEYYSRINKKFDNYPKFENVTQAFGSFLSAIEEFESGGLSALRGILEAEIFDDLLEQAEHLLERGYYGPAAVIAGCVLEDALRKLCDKSDIPLQPKPKLDTMNAELAKSGVYNRLAQKRITALADIRNSAAHGNWSEFSSDDVARMVVEIRSFVERHFG